MNWRKRIVMDEQSYNRGRRQAYTHIMQDCANALGIADPAAAHTLWIAERQAAVNALRDLCDAFGDNDWPDSLHLGDVIEKHLARHLYEKASK